MWTEKQTIITLDKPGDNVVIRLRSGNVRIVGADGNEIVVHREQGGASNTSGVETYDRLVVKGGNPRAELWIGTQARSSTIRVYSGPESGAPANAPDAGDDFEVK